MDGSMIGLGHGTFAALGSILGRFSPVDDGSCTAMAQQSTFLSRHCLWIQKICGFLDS